MGVLAVMGFHLLLAAMGGGITYILGPLGIPGVREELPAWAIAALAALNLTVGVMLYLGFYYYTLKLVRGRTPSIVGDLLYPFRRPLPVIGVAVLYALAVVGGLALLLVPGIVIALTFYYAGVALVDRHLGVLEAFRESSRLTRGHRPPLLLVLLFFILADAVLKGPALLVGPAAGLAANLLSLFVLTPWMAASLMSAYEELLGRTHSPADPGAGPEPGALTPPV